MILHCERAAGYYGGFLRAVDRAHSCSTNFVYPAIAKWNGVNVFGLSCHKPSRMYALAPMTGLQSAYRLLFLLPMAEGELMAAKHGKKFAVGGFRHWRNP